MNIRGMDSATSKFIDDMVAAVRERGDILNSANAAESARLRHEVLLWLLAAAITAVAASTLLGAYITRSIIHPLRRATEVAEQAAKGDLTAEIEVTAMDETGRLLQSLKRMNASHGTIVSDYGGPDFENRAREAGVDRLLRKPYQKRELAEALAAALASR